MNITFLLNKKTSSLLLILIVIVLVILFLIQSKNFTANQNSSPKLTNRCKNQKEISLTKYVAGKYTMTEDGISVINNAFPVNFEFPSPDWKVDPNLSIQFEEPIMFPKPLYSIYFSFPKNNDYPMALYRNNLAFVGFLAFPDYCVTTKEWFSKLPYANDFQTSYRNIDGKNWLITSDETQLPVQYAAMLHTNSYHYEVRMFLRNKQLIKQYKPIFDNLLNSIEFKQKKDV